MNRHGCGRLTGGKLVGGGRWARGKGLIDNVRERGVKLMVEEDRNLSSRRAIKVKDAFGCCRRTGAKRAGG